MSLTDNAEPRTQMAQSRQLDPFPRIKEKDSMIVEAMFRTQNRDGAVEATRSIPRIKEKDGLIEGTMFRTQKKRDGTV